MLKFENINNIFYYYFKLNRFNFFIFWNYLNDIPLISRIIILFNDNFKNIDNFIFKESIIIKNLEKEITDYFKGFEVDFSLNHLNFRNFKEIELNLFEELVKLRKGELITYKELGKRINKPKSYRIVGKILSKNPFPIIIPCHRVINSNGFIGGYNQGIEIKKALLEVEGIKINDNKVVNWNYGITK